MKKIVTRLLILTTMSVSFGLFSLSNLANTTGAEPVCPPTCDFGIVVCPMRQDTCTGLCVPAGDCYLEEC